MRKECEGICRAVRSAVIVGTLWGLTMPLFNHDTTELVVDSMMGKTPDCSSGEASNSEYPYDAIVVPSGGVYKVSDGYYRPNFFQRRRLEAAALAFINGYAPEVVLLDGDQGPDVGDYVNKYYLQAQIENLSGGKIILSNDSVYVENE